MSIRYRAGLGAAAIAFGLSVCVMTATVTGQQVAAGPAAARAGNGAFDPLVTWFGPKSSIREAAFIRVNSADQWARLWEKHEGKSPAVDNVGAPFIPRVNFDKCMVVAIFQGAKTNSNGVTIEAITEEANQIQIRFDESTYQTSSGPDDPRGGAVDVTPFGIFVVPRSNKPIVIEENVQGLKNEPARWKERAKL